MVVTSGVPGFDKLLGGGFEEGSINLLSGKIGTGKSIFCTQFLYVGAANDERGLYLTTSDNAKSIRKQAEKFGWDLAGLEKKKMIKISELEPFDVDVLVDKITDNIDTVNAKRIVIDSATMFEVYIQDSFKIRKFLFRILQRLKDMGKTVLITAEIPEDSKGLSRFGIMELLADSVTVLQSLGVSKYKRSLVVRKMRNVDHSTDIQPFEIGKSGIVVQEA